jgi:hypothetical protein
VKAPLALIFILGLALSGCTKAVTILQPLPPHTTPVTVIRVKFAKQFAPGTFRAELDGKDITAGFAPVAKPNGEAQLVLPDTFEGFTNGTQINTGGSPPRQLPVGTLPPDIHFTPGVAPGTPPSGGSGSSGKSIPNISFWRHTLKVFGQCSGLICDTTDEEDIVPIHLFGNPTTMTVKVGASARATVQAFPDATVPLTVRVRPFNKGVRLDASSAGDPITLQIPPGLPSREFTVTGMQSTTLVLIIEGRGLQRGSIQGLVNP